MGKAVDIRRSFVDSLLLGDDSILLGLWPLKKEFCLLAKPRKNRNRLKARKSALKSLIIGSVGIRFLNTST